MEVFRSTVSSLYLYQGNSAQMKCSLEVLDFKYGTFNIYIYKEIARLCLLWIYYPCSFFFPLWPSFLDIHYDCRNKPVKKMLDVESTWSKWQWKVYLLFFVFTYSVSSSAALTDCPPAWIQDSLSIRDKISSNSWLPWHFWMVSLNPRWCMCTNSKS